MDKINTPFLLKRRAFIGNFVNVINRKALVLSLKVYVLFVVGIQL